MTARPHGEADLAPAVIAGDRRALARAITLIESTKESDQVQAEKLLTAVLKHKRSAMRLGISGSPGVGKSTFIEALGKLLTSHGHRVAVLAVDPSSRRSGGSILGDKTRMEQLARDPNAFIRPSPAGTTLGGVARRTREAILLVEAAGFDVVIVETVGVGQSETAVADMTDLFVLLVNPGGGDDLQGIKRGVMELADMVLVTKADGDLVAAANRTASDYGAALRLMRPKYTSVHPAVLKVSAIKGEGVAEAWDKARTLHESLQAAGTLAGLRSAQSRRWFWSEVQEALWQELSEDANLSARAKDLEVEVEAGRALAYPAARALIRQLRNA